MPDGFYTAVIQTPLMELQASDVGRHIFAQVKLPNTSMRFTFGKIQRYFPPDSTSRCSLAVALASGFKTSAIERTVSKVGSH